MGLGGLGRVNARAAWAGSALAFVAALGLAARAARGEDEASAPSPEEEPPSDTDVAPLPSATEAPSPPAPSEPMMRVPGGTFRMGSVAPRAQPNESPLHLVKIAPFWIDTTEVSVGAYRNCVARGACSPPTPSSSTCTYARGDPELAMSCVTFAMAERFCLAGGKRLPTEAEWELTARGSGTERAYPWGDDAPTCERAIAMRGEKTAEGCSADGPARVDPRRGRSPYGVADLAGNVEEWVSDYYDDRYPAETPGAVVDPRGPRVGTAHVLRGGAWTSPRSGIRTTARSWASAIEQGPTVGFRCAKGEP